MHFEDERQNMGGGCLFSTVPFLMLEWSWEGKKAVSQCGYVTICAPLLSLSLYISPSLLSPTGHGQRQNTVIHRKRGQEVSAQEGIKCLLDIHPEHK